MAKSIIPIRPLNYISPLLQNEQSCLTWYVLSGCSRKDAFVTFARPDMFVSRSKPSVESTVREFFARREVKEYVELYEKTLEDFLRPAAPAKKETGSLEERKSKAKTKLVEFAMSLAENIEQADDPEFVLKIADKCQLLDIDEQVEEVPRRYLPVTCNDCEYRKFIEENCDRVDSGTDIEV